VIITDRPTGEQLCWSEPWTRFSARTRLWHAATGLQRAANPAATGGRQVSRMTGKDHAMPGRRHTIYPRAVPSQGGPLGAAPTVLMPADNEADGMQQTLVSLKSQRQPVGRVIVVADNCTDDTVCAARESGAGVIVTEATTCRKPGAVNQAPEQILSGLVDADAILIQDADTTLVPRLAEVASPSQPRCWRRGRGVLRGVGWRRPRVLPALSVGGRRAGHLRGRRPGCGPVRDGGAVPLSPFRDKGVAK